MISIRLPIDPVAASRPRFGKGFTYIAKKYRVFRELAAELLKQAYKGDPAQGAIVVCVVFTMEKPKSVKREFPCVKPDIDNLQKAIFDAGNQILWWDDSQIVELHAFKEYGEPSILIIVIQK